MVDETASQIRPHYKPYPAYKDSDVEWLGELPAHWEVKASRREFTIQLGKMLQPKAKGPQDSEIPYFKAQHVQWETVRTTDLPIMWADPVDEMQYGVLDGDLLVCEGGEVGRAGIVRNPPDRAIIQNALHRVRSMGTSNIRLLMYLLKHAASQGWFEILCNRATIAHFTSEKFGDLPIPTPPLPEQRAIAAFLDRETAQIDALVAKKERLIELLQEKRTALISDAVTKGLDPDAPLKASGVEWLGEIPAHWDSKRLKTISRIRYGLGQPPRESSKGLPLIRATNVTRGRITERDMVYVDPDDVPTGRDAFLAEGEIIVVRSGAYTADSAIIPKDYDGAVTGYDMVVTVNNELAEFVAVALLCTYVRDAQLVISSMRSAQPHLNAEELGTAVILLPPLPEQRAIAAFLDRETTQIDALVAKVQEAIDRLKELRTALISAAVTGKIDVREAAA